MNNKVAAIILGAGKGTRMNSDRPKVLMPICGKPMIRRIIDTLEDMKTDEIVVVIAPDGEEVKKEVLPYKTAVQEKQLGTGHAVLSAKQALTGFDGTVLVIFGDHPIITSETFIRAANKVREGFSVVVLGFKPDDCLRYGRLKMDKGELIKIVEYKDATEEERKINFCNSGCMAFDSKHLFNLLESIGDNNAAHEFYLTDAVEIARKKDLKCTAIETSAEEVAGANSPEELALLEKFLIKRNGGKCDF